MQGAPMVPDRPDGRRKPGELLSGGYGFYYKAQNQAQQIIQKDDVLQELSNITPEIQSRPRPTEAAKPYKEQITSNVYFSNDKWQDVLTSHGIVVDADKKTLTIQSAAINKDFIYDLTDEEVRKLTSNSITEVSVESRIDLLNEVIKNDYTTKISMDMLNSKELVHLDLNPEVIQELRQQEIDINGELVMDADALEKELLVVDPYYQEQVDAKQGIARVHGESLYEMQDQAWYREGKHGREVSVGEILVEPVRDRAGELEKDNKGNVKYRMTAVINGEAISHEITQKQYDKFMAVDDYHRMKLFSKVFHEVDMKNLPQENKGIHFGAGLLAALTVAGELVRGPRHHPAPDIYMERHGGGHVYMKPNVDSPRDIACRAFEAGVNAAEHGVGINR